MRRVLKLAPRVPEPPQSMYLAGAPSHIIHQDVLAQSQSRREISLPLADFSYPLDEVNQVIIISEHKGVDHYSAAAAGGHFPKGLAQDQRVETHRVLVDSSSLHRHR